MSDVIIELKLVDVKYVYQTKLGLRSLSGSIFAAVTRNLTVCLPEIFSFM